MSSSFAHHLDARVGGAAAAAADTNSFTVVVASNDGRWWGATPEQELAYRKFMHTRSLDRDGSARIQVGKGFYKLCEMSAGQSDRWIEIQDRSKPHKWRAIYDIGTPPRSR